MSTYNQRRALRLPVAVDHEEALLRWQDIDYPVRVMDQSAGGFGIQVECDIDIDAEQRAWLVWGDEFSYVRIVNRVNEGNFVRLSLERMNDSDSSLDGEPETNPWSVHDDEHRSPGWNSSQVVMGMVVLLGFVLAAAAWQWMPRAQTATLRAPTIAENKHTKDAEAAAAEARHRAAKSLQQFAGHWRGEAVSRAIESSKLPRPARTWATKQMQVVQGFTSGILRFLAGAPVNSRKVTTAVEHTVAQTAETATHAVAVVNRVVSSGNESIVNALPRFMDMLSLNDRQRRELGVVLDSARQATAEVHRQVKEIGTQQAMQEIAEIRQSAADSIIKLLSPDQAEKLRSLAASDHPSAAKKLPTQGETAK